MKNYHSTSTRAASSPDRSPAPRPPGTAWTRRLNGFTLVELLVVITIIGILVGLTIPAVIYVRVIAKQAAVTLDLKQLEMACQAYKEKFGEYPPDGTDHSAVLRHLAKAFPRFMIAGADDIEKWDNLRTWIQDSSRWGASVDINTLSPFNALAFWLGGRPAGGQLTGFSANPADLFDTSTSRIGPFFDFDLNRLRADGYYWPQGAAGTGTTGAIVYFRAENGGYATAGAYMFSNGQNVVPAIDTRLSNVDGLYNYDNSKLPVYSWVNPRSIQIFSSGLDVTYSSPITIPPGDLDGCLAFPTGENYDPVGYTYDDITNFSDGTLENAMP